MQNTDSLQTQEIQLQSSTDLNTYNKEPYLENKVLPNVQVVALNSKKFNSGDYIGVVGGMMLAGSGAGLPGIAAGWAIGNASYLWNHHGGIWS